MLLKFIYFIKCCERTGDSFRLQNFTSVICYYENKSVHFIRAGCKQNEK